MTTNNINNKLMLALAFLTGAAIPLSTALQNLTIALIFVVTMCASSMRHQIGKALKNKLVITSILLYLVVLLWTFKSHAPHKDIVHMVVKMRTFLLLPFILSFFSVANNRVSACYGFALGAIITCVMSIVFFITKAHILNSGIEPWNGPFGDWAVFRYHTYHNYFIAMMILVLVSVLVYYGKTLSKNSKIFIYVVMLFSVIDVLYIVQGRAGQILFIIMLGLLFLLWNFRKGLVVLAIIGVATLAVIYTSPAIHSGIHHAEADISQYDDGNARTSVGARIEFEKYSEILIKKKPLLGYGTGSFHYEYYNITHFPKGAPRHPHNDFYWLWVELGLLGPILLILVIFWTCYYGIKQHTPEGRLAAVVSISYAIGALQGGFFTDNISGAAFVIMIGILLNGATFIRLFNPRKQYIL